MSRWERVRLGDVTTQVRQAVKPMPGERYPLLGVKWYAEGPFIREVVTVETSKATTVYQVTPGQFIYNRMFAWKGAFGLVSSAEEGAFVSNEFPLFGCDEDRILPDFLRLYFGQPQVWDYVAVQSTGTTASRSRWKEDQFREHAIALPPLNEQRRIVDVMAAVDAQIEALERELEALGAVALTAAMPSTSVMSRPLEGRVRARGGKRMPKGVQFAGVRTEHPYLRVVDMTHMTFSPADLAYVPDDVWPTIARYTVRRGELVISIVGTIGRVAVVPAWADQANLTENAAVVDVLDVELDTTWLAAWLSSRAGQREIGRVTVGTSQGKLALSRIPLIEVPELSMAEQVVRGRASESAFSSLEATEAELDSLRVFRSTLLSALLSQEIEIPESYDKVLSTLRG